MDLDLGGKVIFISGSSRGIGLGIAKMLLKEDCNVIINGRNEDKLNETKSELGNKQLDEDVVCLSNYVVLPAYLLLTVNFQDITLL